MSFALVVGLHVLVAALVLARHAPLRIAEAPTLVVTLLTDKAPPPEAVPERKLPAPDLKPLLDTALPKLPPVQIQSEMSRREPVVETPTATLLPPALRTETPPPPTPSDILPTYEGQVMAQLARNRRYPQSARMHHEEGTAVLRFTLNRDGSLVSFKLDRSSGHSLLDEEVLAMVRRAAPLPPFPPEMKQATLELIVPVVFSLH